MQGFIFSPLQSFCLEVDLSGRAALGLEAQTTQKFSFKKRLFWERNGDSYLYQFSKKTASNVVVRFHEDFSEPGFANRVVFGIKLVKSVEGIPILKFIKSWGGKKKIRTYGFLQISKKSISVSILVHPAKNCESSKVCRLI